MDPLEIKIAHQCRHIVIGPIEVINDLKRDLKDLGGVNDDRF
jgi:hypothetical protein